MTDRDITAGVITEVDSSEAFEILFIELLFTTPVRVWTGLGPVVATMPDESSQTWIGAGAIGQPDVIIESSDRRRNGLAMSISGVDSSLLSNALTEDYQGKSAKLWIAYLDASASIIADPVLLFAGLMDTLKAVDGSPNGKLFLQCESREQLLQRTSRSLLTDTEQQKLFPGDLGLQFIDEMQSKQLVWGAPNSSGWGGGGKSPGGGQSPRHQFRGVE